MCVYSDVTKYLIEVKQIKGIDEEMLHCYQNTLETVVVKPTLESQCGDLGSKTE